MSKPNHLDVSRVLFIFWLIKFHITLTPPLSRVEPSQISQTILHHPSKNETYHLYIPWVFDRGTSSQRWEGVCHHGGGSRGGSWPLAKPYITLARGQVAPPAPSPVVAHTLPSLDWGLWGFDCVSNTCWSEYHLVVKLSYFHCVMIIRWSYDDHHSIMFR